MRTPLQPVLWHIRDFKTDAHPVKCLSSAAPKGEESHRTRCVVRGHPPASKVLLSLSFCLQDIAAAAYHLWKGSLMGSVL